MKDTSGTPDSGQPADARYVLLPCGHSVEQAAWLGCTETECRPDDARLSAEYFAERAMRRGQVASRGRPS